MVKYELTLIFSGSLTEEKLDAIIEKLKVKETKRVKWGKRLLAYSIKRKRDGFYVYLELESEPEKAIELKKKLEVDSDILRYLLIRV